MVKKKTPIQDDYFCIGCNTKHKKTDFYVSYNKIHNGVYPYCKKFIKDFVSNSDGSTNIDKLKNILRQIDAPFLLDYWNISIEGGGDVVGKYFKNLKLKQNRGFTWEHSTFDNDKKEEEIIAPPEQSELSNKKVTELNEKDIAELEEKWGFGYEPNEYILFEKKWNKLIDNYGRKTAMHVEGLKTYIRFRVKEELATAKGDVKEAKEWGQLASKAATDAKINVSQLSKSDISGGIDVLPQLFEAVESEVGIIPQLPKLLEQPYDDADIIIWCNVNYMRRLEDKPRVSYKEIWDFYDEMLEEYCHQKGYNKKEIEEFKSKRRVPYRNLEEVYIEPVYGDGDLQ